MRPRIRELCRFHFFKSAAILSESQLQRLALPPSAFLLSFPRSFQILHDLKLVRCPRSFASFGELGEHDRLFN